jgi:hypothetical protein
LPATLERALAEATSHDHPDVLWSAPAGLPSTRELRQGLALLTAEAAPVAPRHAALCLAKLTIAFEPNTRLSADAADLRLQVWLEACADLGAALWSEATVKAMQTLKWMPKPAEFRSLVDDRLARRIARLVRCRQLLAMAEARETSGHGSGLRSEEGAARREPVSRPERLRETIRLYRKHGRIVDAERVQEQLDREEKRPVAEQA